MVFAKEPVAGKVKTRLARTLGAERAAELYAAFLEDTLRTARSVASAERCLSYAPASASGRFAALDPEATLLPQPEGDLGARLASAFERAFALGHTRCVALGSDAPHLAPRVLEELFDALATSPIAVLPTDDGGYAAIGLDAPRPELFERIDWSTPRVLAQTLERARRIGLEVRSLPATFDVDGPADLDRLRELLAKEGPVRCPATARLLA